MFQEPALNPASDSWCDCYITQTCSRSWSRHHCASQHFHSPHSLSSNTLKGFQVRLDRAGSNLVWWKVPPDHGRGWNRISFKVPSNSNCSGILWFHMALVGQQDLFPLFSASRGDWLLSFVYRTSSVQLNVAGLQPVDLDDRRMVNMDLSSVVKSHILIFSPSFFAYSTVTPH